MDRVSPQSRYGIASRIGRKLLKWILGPVLVQQTWWNKAAHRALLGLRKDVEESHRRLERLQSAQGDQHRARQLEHRLNVVETELMQLRIDLQERLPDTCSAGLNYAAFEDRFRGSREEIRRRQKPYVDLFRGNGPVLDLGCGRGELLELLSEAGIMASGVDQDVEMVKRCRDAGISVHCGNALDHLESCSEASLGGIVASHLVEHLPSLALPRLVRACFSRLRPAGVLVVETPNPRSLVVLAEAFHIDLTHIRPIHPEAIRFVLEDTGFVDLDVRYLSPVDGSERLPTLPSTGLPEEWRDVLTQAFERTDRTLFGERDYAVIAHRPAESAVHPGYGTRY